MRRVEHGGASEINGSKNIMSEESIKNPRELNLLTNFDVTVEAIKDIEGLAWYRSYFSDV
jgi:hypothetical protein